MFNNLPECKKVKEDNKRRLVLFIVTSTVWILSLVGTVAGRIVLYDAQLEEANKMFYCSYPFPSHWFNSYNAPATDEFNILYRNYLKRYLLVKNNSSCSCGSIKAKTLETEIGQSKPKIIRSCQERYCIHTHVIIAVCPEYPVLAREKGISGDVPVEVEVNPKGEVTLANALYGDPLLQTAAVKATKQWQFKPDLPNFRRVITYRFKLD